MLNIDQLILSECTLKHFCTSTLTFDLQRYISYVQTMQSIGEPSAPGAPPPVHVDPEESARGASKVAGYGC